MSGVDRELPSLPRRPDDSHKGTYGRVLLVAGTRGMAGAAILTARAALRGGAGLVTLAVPRELSDVCAVGAPEATQVVLPDAGLPDFANELEKALEQLHEGTYQSVGIGPGLGTSAGSRALVSLVLERYRGPQIVDADALNLVAQGVEPHRTDARVWTPHPGEFRRLTGTLPKGDRERIEAAGELARSRGGTVLLKGHRTVIHDGERSTINLTGSSGLASGGTGDVLTGLIASLLAQGLEPFDAARLGAYLHGLAGDLAARRLGQASLTAGDVIDFLPHAFTSYERFSTAAPRHSGG